jgi:hypothetical protein
VIEAGETFDMASKTGRGRIMTQAFRERLPATDVLMRAWALFIQRHEKAGGSAADRYTRERFYKLLGAVHLRPGENELFYLHALERDSAAPPMDAAPSADEVVYTFRGDDYAEFSKAYEGSVFERVFRTYMNPMEQVHPLACGRGERIALVCLAAWLDGHALLNGVQANRTPSNSMYWAELAQHTQTGTCVPPSSPEEAYLLACKRTCSLDLARGVDCTLVRILRRCYVVVRCGTDLVTVDLGLGSHAPAFLTAILVWMAACPPTIWSTEGSKPSVPMELREMINNLRKQD